MNYTPSYNFLSYDNSWTAIAKMEENTICWVNNWQRIWLLHHRIRRVHNLQKHKHYGTMNSAKNELKCKYRCSSISSNSLNDTGLHNDSRAFKNQIWIFSFIIGSKWSQICHEHSSLGVRTSKVYQTLPDIECFLNMG